MSCWISCKPILAWIGGIGEPELVDGKKPATETEMVVGVTVADAQALYELAMQGDIRGAVEATRWL